MLTFRFPLYAPRQRRWRRGGGGSSWTNDPSERELYFDSVQESCVYFDCQVLPLIVCNAFLCVYLECVFVVSCETHTVEGCDSPRTRHTRWCYYYASGLFRLLSTLVSPFGSFFPPHDKHCLLDWCYWLSRLVSHLMWTPPPIVVFVWRPQNVSKSSFLHLSVKCKEWRMLMSMVCVVRDKVKRVKRVWESIETHDLTPSFFYF